MVVAMRRVNPVTNFTAEELEGMAAVEILSEDKELITYRRKLRTITGTVTSTILLQQIFHLWKNNKRKPFYKFSEPCKHPKYGDGDSFCEELGFSINEFRAARDEVAVKFTSELSKKIAKAKLAEQCLVIYWTDADRVTWYDFNEKLFHKLLIEAYTVLSTETTIAKSAIRENRKYLDNSTIHSYLDKYGNQSYPSSETTETTETIAEFQPNSAGVVPTQPPEATGQILEALQRDNAGTWIGGHNAQNALVTNYTETSIKATRLDNNSGDTRTGTTRTGKEVKTESGEHLYTVPQIAGGSGLDPSKVKLPASITSSATKKEQKKTQYLPATSAAKYLAGQEIGRWKHHWLGFTSKDERDDWLQMETLYEFETIRKKIDYFVKQGVGLKHIAQNVITAMKNHVQSDKKPEPVYHDNRQTDIAIEIPKPKFGSKK